jgi:CheY-like chemotaxis protein
LNIAAVIDASIPETLIGDPLRLKQILLNFINNAIKSTENGSVLIKVICNNIDKSINRVSICFEISDTGRGLSDEEKEKLFLPLKVKDSDENESEEQNSTGLYVCKYLSELMNGKINVKSEIGKGSKFQFVTDFVIEPSPGYKKIIPSISAKGLNCLVISDNPVTRKILNLHINQWGAYCSEATNTDEAIEKLNTALDIRPYEIVLSDFNNADISVYENFIKSIKRFKNLENLKLVCLTSKSKRGDAEILGTMGYSAYLTKPIKQSHLYKCLLMLKGLHEGRCDPGQTGVITKHMIDDFDQDCYRVLIVSDTIKRLQKLLFHLYKLRIRCDFTQNEELAIKAYKNKYYDLVFIDCICETVNGIDISRRMSDCNLSTKGIPIIGISNGSNSTNETTCRKAGMIDTIEEPFERKKTALILKNLLID